MRTAETPGIKPQECLRVRVAGPDTGPLDALDLRRLFPSGALTAGRYDRLASWSRLVACCGDTPVAVATCRRVNGELRVPDVGLDTSCGCDVADIMAPLMNALELACLAGGARRVVMLAPPSAHRALQRRGYTIVNEGCAGGWAEKVLR